MQANLEEFERAVYCRPKVNRLEEGTKALNAMFQCLMPLREGAHFEGHDLSNPVGDFTRMASAITAMIVDPWFRPTVEGFQHLTAHRNIIDTIFKASAFGNADHVFNLVSEDSKNVNKFLLFLTMGSKLTLDLEAVFRTDPAGTFGLYLALIGHPHVFTKEADERREKLLELYPIFADVELPTSLYNALCGAYMHVSYAHGDGKHEPKRLFHKLIHKGIAPYIEQPAFHAQIRKDRPTVVIVFEWWHSAHAMYRSYAQSIRQLKRDFRIVGCCPGAQSDTASKAMFDGWIDFNAEDAVLADIARKIQAESPDIIYYPSVGMAVWVIAMASLRLAPIQVMTYGHPATTNSETIDYGLIEADCYVPECFSEKVITLPNNVVRPSRLESGGARHTPRRSDVIRIGVAAMQVKVSWPFIRTLQQIQEFADKKVEVEFFSAVYGVGLYAFANELERMIANLYVQARQHYQDYMASLSKCDICLFSFPFGGANSMYDALELGLPMVSMEGLQPHSRSDASIMRRAGLPERWITHSEDEYANAVLELLDDDTRIAFANQVAAVDVQGKFFTSDESDAFVDAFVRIYRENTVEMAA